MAYNPSTNIVVSGKTFMDVPAVQFKTPDGATVNFAHVGGSIRFSPTLEEQTNNVENFSNAIIDPITSTLLNQLDSDFVAENIKKGVDLFGLSGTLEAGGGGTEELSALLKIFGCSDYEISVVQEDTAYSGQRINIPITNETLKSSLRFILIPGTNSLFPANSIKKAPILREPSIPANAIKKAPILRGPSMPDLQGFFAYIWPYYSNPYTTHGSIISMLHVRLDSFVYDEDSSFTQDGTVFVFANNTLTIHFDELSSKAGYSEYFFDNIIGTKVLLMGGNVQ